MDPFERLGGIRYSPRNPRPINLDDVRRLEAEIGNPIPVEYVDFLLRHPFGPITFGMRLSFLSPRGRRINLEGLYGIVLVDPGHGCDLASTFRSYNDHLLPTHWLAVADMECDFVCLELVGENRGKVYLFEHELFDYNPAFDTGEDGVLPNEESYCFLAPSFGEFLAMLSPVED
jgi:hypothetical protein